MCGIAGVVGATGQSVSQTALTEVLGQIRHRGPDDEGIWQEHSVALLHTRLSIIDLSPTGAQPMMSPNGRWVLIFNGEIYNHALLRDQLRGIWSFRGTSDTEVLLAALATWGIEAVRNLNGMYAFALWDRQRRELLLCRDPVGIKPLFYARQTSGAFVFCSEIKGLRPICPAFRAAYGSIHEFMFYGAPLGRKTLYQDIWQLLPGEVLRFRPDTDCVERWIEAPLEGEAHLGDPQPSISVCTIRDRIRAAVESQLVADVPVGVLLSGGLDSSTITAFASDLGKRTISTFSIGFGNSPLENELSKARSVSRHFRTDHHEQLISSSDVLPILDRMVDVYDGPFSDAANLPLFLLYGKLKGRYKVMLQGDGGDEIFAGYRRYQALERLRYWQAANPLLQWAYGKVRDAAPIQLHRLARFSAAITQPDPALRMAYLLTVETNEPSPIRLLSPGLRQQVRCHDPFSRYREANDALTFTNPAQRMLWTDCKILLPDIFLTKVDRASMAQGIEVRVPLLDLNLVRTMLTMPASGKVSAWSSKILMRRAMRGILPPAILHQRKSGFGVPVAHWLKTGLRQALQDTLLDPAVIWADVFDRPALELCLKQHLSGERDNGFLLWKMMNFALWLRQSRVTLS